MKQAIFTIASNRLIAENTYEMKISGDASAITKPGQFVNIKLEGKFLRRPISICDWSDNSITLIYKVVGKGSAMMSAMAPGEKLDLLVGLGNGFDISACSEKALVIGGGVGIAPMYGTAKALKAAGKKVSAVLGFNGERDMYYIDEFKEICDELKILTADGSCGEKGLVTDGMEGFGPGYYLFTCGPEPMLKAVYKASAMDGQFSFEERMGCGFGACMGCSCETKYGYKRICKDGPVLLKEEIIW